MPPHSLPIMVAMGMGAVLAFDEIDMKRHSGVISEFRRRYIKTEIFETRMSEIISVLFDVRTDSDYDDFFVISKADTRRTGSNLIQSQIRSSMISELMKNMGGDFSSI